MRKNPTVAMEVNLNVTLLHILIEYENEDHTQDDYQKELIKPNID